MELDQLYKRVRRSHKERLAFLQQYPELIKQRDDLILEEITLLNQTGEYEKAKTVLDAHNFHPWEGGDRTEIGILHCVFRVGMDDMTDFMTDYCHYFFVGHDIHQSGTDTYAAVATGEFKLNLEPRNYHR